MITVILDFIFLNWAAFLQYCADHGILDEEEIERELEKLKKKDQ